MNLAEWDEWAETQHIHPQTAYRWFWAGKLPAHDLAVCPALWPGLGCPPGGQGHPSRYRQWWSRCLTPQRPTLQKWHPARRSARPGRSSRYLMAGLPEASYSRSPGPAILSWRAGHPGRARPADHHLAGGGTTSLEGEHPEHGAPGHEGQGSHPLRHLSPAHTAIERRKPSLPGWTAEPYTCVESPTTSSPRWWRTPTARWSSKTSTSLR